MPDGDGEDPPGGTEKRKIPNRNPGTAANDEDFYKAYVKPGYKRLFLENSVSGDFNVFVESTKDNEKIGNNNPIVTTNLFKNDIKGMTNIRRINANKICVTFSQSSNANNFLKNDQFLLKHQLKAYIPATAVETVGVLRYVPTSISNEELFKKLSSSFEIIGVRRFTKKDNGHIKPFQTVSVTFLSTALPEYVYLDLFRFRVYQYNAPLLQCFKCFKFNHGAKICKSEQKCSICSEEHHFSVCTSNKVAKCVNCQGAHLAISRDCPIKKQKIEDKKNKETYANVVLNKSSPTIKNYQTDFPTLSTPKPNSKPLPSRKTQGVSASPTPISTASVDTSTSSIENKEQSQNMSNEKLIDEILSNDYIRKGLIGALVAIGNEKRAITNSVIQEILINSFKGRSFDG
ncbi:hypothetical protein ABMA28_015338 [Loxostege sticticalis]|uniref:Gag-like protein n=1 Tax=Loxostege sticticalis TaxID=481309 RepID=A0ABD0T9F6_LOXSC